MRPEKIIFTLILFASIPLYSKEPVEVPLNIGFGPALNYIPKVISDDQTFHYSLKLDICAVLDKNFIESHKDRIPKKYRGLLEGKDEFRVSYIFIPELLIISPKIEHTGIYGVNFRPVTLRVPFVSKTNFKNGISIGLDLTYMFIYSDKIFDGEGSMNFLRPGLNLQFDNLIRFSKSFLVSFGLDSYFYIPQEIKDRSPIIEIGNLDRAIWFIGQVYIIINFRVPYKTRI
jgi:hypothetical protein